MAVIYTGEDRAIFERAVEIVIENTQASASMIQRKLRIGYGQAARMVDEMEALGIIEPFQGIVPRKALISMEQWETAKETGRIPTTGKKLPFAADDTK